MFLLLKHNEAEASLIDTYSLSTQTLVFFFTRASSSTDTHLPQIITILLIKNGQEICIL